MKNISSNQSFAALFQAGDSTDTLTSSSSVDVDLDHRDVTDVRGGMTFTSHVDGLSSGYTHLLEDDDSGIVVRTNSQTSLDQQRFDSKFEVKFDSNFSPAGSGTGAGVGSHGAVDTQTAQRLPTPTPRGGARKSVSPAVTGSPVIADRIIRPVGARERPKPAPRRMSMENQAGPVPAPRTPDMCGNSEDALINLDTDVGSQSRAGYDIVSEFSNLDASGDYVRLREDAVKADSVDRRSSINRTPAIKLGQNETPKRPSIRRERSPVSPNDSGHSSFLDFDPLSCPNTPNQSQHSASSLQTSTAATTSHEHNEDSLLKDWHIGHFTNVNTTPPKPNTQSAYMYSHHPTPPPRANPLQPQPMAQFYSPQTTHMASRQTVGPSVGFNNPLSQFHKPPQVPPKPTNRNSLLGPSSQSATGMVVNQSNDPFADLLNMNQSTQSQQPAQNWETFS